MVAAAGRSAKQLVNWERRGMVWQWGGWNLCRFLRRIWRSVNRLILNELVSEDSVIVFAARSILIAKGVGAREDNDGRTRLWRRMSCEGCLVRSDAKNCFEACIICTKLLTRRATCDFDAATKCDEDENEEDERWHRTSTMDEASCVGDGKETGGGC
jgi:hypothetical protein